MNEKIVGECPRGCGKTLIRGSAGHVTCSYENCPEPSAADKLLREAAYPIHQRIGRLSVELRKDLKGSKYPKGTFLIMAINALKLAEEAAFHAFTTSLTVEEITWQ